MQRIVSRFIGDASTRVAALEAGEIDISDATPILDMKRLKDTRGYDTMIGNAAGIPFGLELNGSRGIFAESRCAARWRMALDRPALCDNLFFGLIEPAYGRSRPTRPATGAAWRRCYKPDAKAAAALLDKAGWKPGPDGIRVKNGQRLSGFYGAPPPLEPDTAVEIQAVAKRVGIELKVETITFAKNQELVFDNSVRHAAGALDPGGSDVPGEPVRLASTSPAPATTNTTGSQLKDPKLDALFDQGRAVTDQAKRDAIYADAQKIIMESAVWLPVHNQVQTVATRTAKKGWHFARTSWVVLFYDVTSA